MLSLRHTLLLAGVVGLMLGNTYLLAAHGESGWAYLFGLGAPLVGLWEWARARRQGGEATNTADRMLGALILALAAITVLAESTHSEPDYARHLDGAG